MMYLKSNRDIEQDHKIICPYTNEFVSCKGLLHCNIIQDKMLQSYN